MSKLRSGASAFRANGAWAPYVFLTPTVVLFLCIFLFPALFIIHSSFFRWNMLKPQAGKTFIGLKNFSDLLTNDQFLQALIVTGKFVLYSTPTGLLLGLGLALLLNRSYRGKKWIQGALLSPMMVAPVAIYLSWRFLLEPTFGVVNYVLGWFGIMGPGWFSDASTALISVVMVDVWSTVPFVFLVMYAALQAVPQDPVESAQVDGANRWQIFWNVTLPAIKPVLLVVLIMRIMDTIRIFDNIYVLTRGGPANATRTVQFLDYELAFNAFDIGKGSALALMIVCLILLVGSLLIREMNRTNEELRY
jgi:multiple sugar transport system permease protein